MFWLWYKMSALTIDTIISLKWKKLKNEFKKQLSKNQIKIKINNLNSKFNYFQNKKRTVKRVRSLG